MIFILRFPRVRGDVPWWLHPPSHRLWFSPRARGCSEVATPADRYLQVFPACAGMFRKCLALPPPFHRFPRVRGDVPLGVLLRCGPRGFSPRARGCSYRLLRGQHRGRVFPACAGMFLRSPVSEENRKSFPRVRGDVPTPAATTRTCGQFSPRARGCSESIHISLGSRRVFPACAGMFRLEAAEKNLESGFPRVRGDVPVLAGAQLLRKGFSPRARGCSAAPIFHFSLSFVFPACAGMFLRGVRLRRKESRFPRVRGDVPQPASGLWNAESFSPRARGCSYSLCPSKVSVVVFPACAGMFRKKKISFSKDSGFPRVRGDVPSRPARSPACLAFSPRARGCSSALNPENRPHSVFPACAGMFPPQKNAPRPPRSFPRVRGDVPLR